MQKYDPEISQDRPLSAADAAQVPPTMPRGAEKEYRVLHLFSPYAHHDEQGIIGNGDGLRALLKAVEKALETGNSKSTFFVSDGEGYDLFVKYVNDEQLNKIAVPYTVDYCEEDRKDAIYPWTEVPEGWQEVEG